MLGMKYKPLGKWMLKKTPRGFVLQLTWSWALEKNNLEKNLSTCNLQVMGTQGDGDGKMVSWDLHDPKPPPKRVDTTPWNLPFVCDPLSQLLGLHMPKNMSNSSLVNLPRWPPSTLVTPLGVRLAHVDILLQRTRFADTLFQIISSGYFCVCLRIQVPGTSPSHLEIQV